MKRKKKSFHQKKKNDDQKRLLKGGVYPVSNRPVVMPKSIPDDSLLTIVDDAQNTRDALHSSLQAQSSDLGVVSICQVPTVDGVQQLCLLFESIDELSGFCSDLLPDMCLFISQQQDQAVVADHSFFYSAELLQRLMDGIRNQFGESVACACAESGLRTAFYQASDFVQEALGSYTDYDTQRVLAFVQQCSGPKAGLRSSVGAAQWTLRAIHSFFCVSDFEKEQKEVLIRSICNPVASQILGEKICEFDNLEALNARDSSSSSLKLVKQIQSLGLDSDPIVLSYTNVGPSEGHMAGMVLSVEEGLYAKPFLVIRNLNSFVHYEEAFSGVVGDVVSEFKIPLLDSLQSKCPFENMNLDEIKQLFERFIVSDGSLPNGVRSSDSDAQFSQDFKQSVSTLSLSCVEALYPDLDIDSVDFLSTITVDLEKSMVVPKQKGDSCTMYLMRIVSSLLGSTTLMDQNLTKLADTVHSAQQRAAVILQPKLDEFYQAVFLEDSFMIEFLMRSGLGGLKDQDGFTALMFAIQSGNELVVDCLIHDQWDVDLNATNVNGQTALFFAVANDYPSIVEKLLGLNADQCQQDSEGYTALMYAVFLGHDTCIEKLLDGNKAAINFKNSDGNTALMLAVDSGDPIIVKQLLDFGADSMIPNKRGQTPLDMAQNLGNAAIIDLLK